MIAEGAAVRNVKGYITVSQQLILLFLIKFLKDLWALGKGKVLRTFPLGWGYTHGAIYSHSPGPLIVFVSDQGRKEQLSIMDWPGPA